MTNEEYEILGELGLTAEDVGIIDAMIASMEIFKDEQSEFKMKGEPQMSKEKIRRIAEIQMDEPKF